MTIMNKSIIAVLGFCLIASVSFAQKFGYCNSNALLADLPEVKQADTNLKNYQTQLTNKGQNMVKAYQEAAASLQKKQDEGVISPNDIKRQTEKLQKDQEAIQSYEKEVYEKLASKRSELFTPILDAVNKAMADVAKEQGMMYVFDTGSSVLLYADESLDVTTLVKEKYNSSKASKE